MVALDGETGEVSVGVQVDDQTVSAGVSPTSYNTLTDSGDLGSKNAGNINSAYSKSVNELDLQIGGKDGDTKSTQELLDCEEVDTRCRWGSVEPDCCAPCTNVKVALFVLCCAAAIQGMVVNGFVNVSLSSVEKRFSIESKDAGLIASMYDIASLLCLIPVGYFGGQGSKPRWLGFGILIMGIGSLIFALPQFLTGKYEYLLLGEDSFCDLSNGTATSCDETGDSTLWRYKYMLYFGQFLHGVGAAPLYTLGVTYIDENLTAKMSAVYVGIFYAMSILGPAIGYVLGGLLLSYYTDFYAVDQESLLIDTDSEVWVGAWWLGPLICALLAIIVAFPLLGFPKHLPGYLEIAKQRVQEAYGGKTDSGPAGTGFASIKHFPTAVKILFTNPTFIFLSLGSSAEGMVVGGFSAFLPKYLEAQFSQTASRSALLVGAITVPAGGLGMFVGGYIVKRFSLKVASAIRFCVILNVIIFLLAIVFLIRCPEVDFAGVSVNYDGSPFNGDASVDTLQSACNDNCSCSFINFQPVCGGNDVMYFNPCAAGCLVVDENDDSISVTELKYSNCTCVLAASEGRDDTTQGGKCETPCVLMPLFLAVFLVVIFLTFCTTMPALSATLRCVPKKQRSFAVSIQWLFIRLLGAIPGPILFGTVFDESCLFWKPAHSVSASCGGAGGDGGGGSSACYFYDSSALSTYMLSLSLVCKFVSACLFAIAMCLYKPPPTEDREVQPEEMTVNASTSDQEKGASEKSVMYGTDDKPRTERQGGLPNGAGDASPGGFVNVAAETKDT